MLSDNEFLVGSIFVPVATRFLANVTVATTESPTNAPTTRIRGCGRCFRPDVRDPDGFTCWTFLFFWRLYHFHDYVLAYCNVDSFTP